MIEPTVPAVSRDTLREAIKAEYGELAEAPEKGFHYRTGHDLASVLGYRKEWLEPVPEAAIAPFAGTGNPFLLGELRPGERVLDMGSGGGIDSLIAAGMVGSGGEVVGVDMTPEMLERARGAALEAGATNVRFVQGFIEELPVADHWADVVISNGVLNLVPSKTAVMEELFRVLKPGGRLQFGDILVEIPVPESAKEDISLWTG